MPKFEAVEVGICTMLPPELTTIPLAEPPIRILPPELTVIPVTSPHPQCSRYPPLLTVMPLKVASSFRDKLPPELMIVSINTALLPQVIKPLEFRIVLTAVPSTLIEAPEATVVRVAVPPLQMCSCPI